MRRSSTNIERISNGTGDHSASVATKSPKADEFTPQTPSRSESLCELRAQKMHDFYTARQLCDVCLRCGEKEIWAHRVVLASACEYFERMFNSGMIESRQRDVQIHGIEPGLLEILVNYCYTGEIRIDTDNVQGILSGACMLRLEDVMERCSVFVRSQMDATNCLKFRTLADIWGCEKLHRSAHDYTTSHFMEVMKQSEFLDLSFEDVLCLLASDDLNVTSESVVYDAMYRWLKRDINDRRQYASRLVSAIRLPLLPADFLASCIDNEIFQSDPTIQALFIEALTYHLVPDRRIQMNVGDRSKPRKSTVGLLYVIGGVDSNKKTPAIEQYDYLKNCWSVVGQMPTRRLHFGVAALDSKIYLVGGRDDLKTLNAFECWEPATNIWTTLPPINTPRHGLGVAVLENVIYVIGGHDGWSYLSTAERYDPVGKTWAYTGEMSTVRSAFGVAVLNGRIYAIGGRDSGQCLRTVECYNPHTNKWSLCTPMLKRRGIVGVGVLHGYIYAAGGIDSLSHSTSSTKLACVERYDPKTDCWTIITQLSFGRDGIALCTVGSLLFAIGGHSGSSYLQLVECYDPETNEWHQVNNLIVERAGTGAAVVPRVQPSNSGKATSDSFQNGSDSFKK